MYKLYSRANFTLLAFALMTSLPLVQAQSGPQVWTAPGNVRVGREQAPSSQTTARLRAARAEYEPFQVIVTAPVGGLTNVNATGSDLLGPGGAVISHANYKFYREQYINVTKPSPDYGTGNRALGAGWYADGLIPFSDSTGKDLAGALDAVPFAVTPRWNQPLWIDLFVPRDAIPGDYNGTVTVTSNQGNAVVNVVLTVWNFTLPAKPTLKSSFGLHGTQINKANDEVLLQHKLMPIVVEPGDSPDLHNRLGLNSTALWFASGANNKTCTMQPPPSVSTLRAALNSYPSTVSTYVYVADEVDRCPTMFDSIKQWSRNVHEAGTKTLITATPNPSLYDDGTGRSAVDIWVLLPAQFDLAGSHLAEVQAKGNEIWSYNCLIQDAHSPKWLLDYSPINYRIQAGFINQSLGVKGLLYWGVDTWTSDPWNNLHALIDGQFTFPGEGMLIYPGQQVGVPGSVPSMRLKWLREGVDDFEYVEMLKAEGKSQWTLDLLKTVAMNFTNWTKDPEQLESVRQQFGEELHRLSGGTVPPPPPPATLTASSIIAAGLTPAGATIGWITSQPATTQLEYGTTPAYGTLTGLNSTMTVAHSLTLTGLQSAKTYHFRVRSKNAAGTEVIGTGSSFLTLAAPVVPPPPVSTLPAVPVVATPTNGAVSVSTAPVLRWQAAARATSYEIYGGTSPNGMGLITAVTGTSFSPGRLSSRTTYYWKVVAKNSAGATSSPVMTFKTR